MSVFQDNKYIYYKPVNVNVSIRKSQHVVNFVKWGIGPVLEEKQPMELHANICLLPTIRSLNSNIETLKFNSIEISSVLFIYMTPFSQRKPVALSCSSSLFVPHWVGRGQFTRLVLTCWPAHEMKPCVSPTAGLHITPLSCRFCLSSSLPANNTHVGSTTHCQIHNYAAFPWHRWHHRSSRRKTKNDTLLSWTASGETAGCEPLFSSSWVWCEDVLFSWAAQVKCNPFKCQNICHVRMTVPESKSLIPQSISHF